MVFPSVIAEIIVSYAIVPKLRKELNLADIAKQRSLWSNPMAYVAGLLDVTQMEQNAWESAKNPALIDYIKANPALYLAMSSIWENEAAYEWLISLGLQPSSCAIYNNHPDAVAAVIARICKYDHISWNTCPTLTLPNAWPFLNTQRHLWTMDNDGISDNDDILANPAAIEAIIAMPRRCLTYSLLRNPHPLALDIALSLFKPVPYLIASNPGIFVYDSGADILREVLAA